MKVNLLLAGSYYARLITASHCAYIPIFRAECFICTYSHLIDILPIQAQAIVKLRTGLYYGCFRKSLSYNSQTVWQSVCLSAQINKVFYDVILELLFLRHKTIFESINLSFGLKATLCMTLGIARTMFRLFHD